MPHVWESSYTDLPFQDGGRDFTGVDCWGLVRLIYAKELSIELPSYAEISAKSLIAVAREIGKGKDGLEWQEIEREAIKPFDVAVMTLYGSTRVGHVGVITSNRKVMHVELGCAVVVVSLDHIQIRERVKCFRRHKTLL